MAFSLLAYLATFSGQLYFLRRFFIYTSLTTLTLQLLFRSNYFFRAAAFFKEFLFRKSHFLAAVIFSEYLIFRNETCIEQPLCENKKLFRAVNFRNSFFLVELLLRINISTEKPLWSKQVRLHGISLLFLEATFFEQSLFQNTLPSVAATFSEELFSHNILFQKSCYFIATPSLHSYTNSGGSKGR